jgi:penicillin-binding protein 1C
VICSAPVRSILVASAALLRVLRSKCLALYSTLRHHRLRLTTAGLIAAAIAFWYSLPHPLFDEPYSSVLLSREGHLLGARVAADGQWRFPQSHSVPDKFRHALIHFEDRRFLQHPGVDPAAVGRALYLNLTRGKVVSGASTLSMQVIRLARGDRERTYLQKAVESILALRLELAFSKDEILALHASHAPFGGNVVGLEAASWRYFGRPPEHLTWAEACTLAVLPNSPKLIHPGKNRERLRAKRDRLLRSLHEAGELDAMELALALAEPLPAEPKPLPRLAPHLLDTLSAEAGKAEPRFHSTIDVALQAATQEIVERHAQTLQRQDIRNVAALVVDNQTFQVVAYVGNTDPISEEDQGHAVDVVRRPRSTGSTLKPLLFAAMLEAGEILPGSLVPDLPTQYGGFMPENFDRSYRGAVPAQLALARSLNIPAVRMLKAHGVPRFHAFLRNAGMTTLERAPDDYGLTLILGGAEGTLWDLATMYANLADIAARGAPGHAGNYRKLAVLRDEKTDTGRPRDIGPGAAWLTLDALLEVNRPDAEAHWKSFASAQRVAWKTGTSFGQRDGWAIGSTARYTVAVWVGNATGEGRADLTGVASAAPVMFAIFNRLGPSPWFRMPEADLKQIKVCKDDGYLPSGGCETEPQWVPLNSHFERQSPYHRLVHLDARGRRVDGRCESPARMQHASWFVLPPGQEFYYRKVRPDYRPLPQLRGDCAASAADRQNPIDFLYPDFGTRLYIPIDLAAKKGRTVFEAVHRDREATLYWHLDDQYLGSTSTFHQLALDISPGVHVITVVDRDGNRLARRFEVLAKTAQPSSP